MPPTDPTTPYDVVPAPVWRAREAAHEARVDAATAAHRERRRDGRRHPVEDFLFTYYPHSPGKLRRWHPGAGVLLEGAADDERAQWRFHRVVGDGVLLDVEAFLAVREGTVRFVRELLTRTLDRPPTLGCFGLHEWAMAYRLTPEQQRHADWPLRLGADGTDAVVEAHQISCSHVDAYRFFTPDALPRNAIRPTRERQVELEQPGCLHAGMDLYKWSFKLSPAIPSDLVADCFDLAREIRELDMRAAPYDLAELGYEPVRIETREGKAAYVAAQRGFAERGNALRRRLVAVLDDVLARDRRDDVEPEQRQDASRDDGARDLADAAGAEPQVEGLGERVGVQP